MQALSTAAMVEAGKLFRNQKPAILETDGPDYATSRGNDVKPHVWKAGEAHSNLIESVHADVNREGVWCTLVGGLTKGQAFDKMKMKTLEVFEAFNIRPSNKSGHVSENAIKSLKRKNVANHRNLSKEDEEISAHNDKAQKSYGAWQKASKSQLIAAGILQGVNPETQHTLYQTRFQEFTKSHQACELAEEKYQKDVESGVALKDTGSGKIKFFTVRYLDMELPEGSLSPTHPQYDDATGDVCAGGPFCLVATDIFIVAEI
ncbi:hypothetical protein B0H14DRAFT_3136936 [Mycena olivaceomarginata]|nr:hypothetical protein B0H14DRAFT_3136936 [Mycena olivaceomarginata]